KRNLLANLGPSQTLVTNADDPLLELWAQETPATVLRFSLRPPGTGTVDAWCDPATGGLFLHGQPLIRRDELQVPGAHHVANALAVALAASAAGVDAQALRRALRGFTGLPGRYAVAGQVGGITFV